MPKSSKLGFTTQPYVVKAPYGITNYDPNNSKIITDQTQTTTQTNINSYDGKNVNSNLKQQGKY